MLARIIFYNFSLHPFTTFFLEPTDHNSFSKKKEFLYEWFQPFEKCAENLYSCYSIISFFLLLVFRAKSGTKLFGMGLVIYHFKAISLAIRATLRKFKKFSVLRKIGLKF